MIDFLQGKVVDTTADYIVLEQNGMGYQIYVTHPSSFQEDQSIRIYSHLIVREDAWRLYGFRKKSERDIFRLLLEVSGVGPKAAINMMIGAEAVQIVQAIKQENVRFLTGLPGIGKKTAQRMILDLKEKLPKSGLALVEETSLEVPPAAGHHLEQDVVEALVGLGYSEQEAWSAVQSIPKDQTVEASIKEALNYLMMK